MVLDFLCKVVWMTSFHGDSTTALLLFVMLPLGHGFLFFLVLEIIEEGLVVVDLVCVFLIRT